MDSKDRKGKEASKKSRPPHGPSSSSKHQPNAHKEPTVRQGGNKAFQGGKKMILEGEQEFQGSSSTRSEGVPRSIRNAPKELHSAIRRRQSAESARRCRLQRKTERESMERQVEQNKSRIENLEKQVNDLSFELMGGSATAGKKGDSLRSVDSFYGHPYWWKHWSLSTHDFKDDSGHVVFSQGWIVPQYHAHSLSATFLRDEAPSLPCLTRRNVDFPDFVTSHNDKGR